MSGVGGDNGIWLMDTRDEERLKRIKIMELWKKALLIGITLFVAGFFSLYMFLSLKGKEILSKSLEKAFRQKVTIENLYITFPVVAHIKKIEVAGLFKADEIIAGIGLFDIFSKDIKLTSLKIIKPVVTIEKNPPPPAQKRAVSQEPGAQEVSGVPSQPKPAAGAGEAAVQQPPATGIKEPAVQGQSLVGFLLSAFSRGHFVISDGTVDFIDRTVGDKELTIRVENIDFRVDNINPRRGIKLTSFELKGTIPWRQQIEKGKLQVEGWINLAKRDIQATLKIKDIDGVYLNPYYSTWLDLEKLRVEKANLNFNSNIQGLNNNVIIDCHLELTDIVRKQSQGEEAPESEDKAAVRMVDVLKTLDQNKIVLNFTWRTKLDKLEFDFGNIKMALKNKLP